MMDVKEAYGKTLKLSSMNFLGLLFAAHPHKLKATKEDIVAKEEVLFNVIVLFDCISLLLRSLAISSKCWLLSQPFTLHY